MILEIVFAAGCFWGVEKNFEQIEGVVDVVSGYAGGNYDNPTYKTVLKYRHGDQISKWLSKIGLSNDEKIINHTESVKVTYDTNVVSSEFLIKEFWELHDPTQKNRQGNDIGNNYRSAIYWTTPEQQNLALKTRDEYQQLLREKGYGEIQTELKPLDKFWAAEDEHQDYLVKNPNGYCPDHRTGVKFAHKGKGAKPTGEYNAHLKNVILEPLGGKEIVVIEAEYYCPYCEAFREKVLKHYEGTIPVRHVFAHNLKGYEIKTALFATPTVLFIENGVEVAGFQGYLPPEDFYHALGKFKLGEGSEAFDVAFNQGTDAKFCKQYEIFKDTPDGVFIDKLSGKPLFDTKDRFNSETGWLSFYQAVDGETIERPDHSYGLNRTEVVSKSSGIHLGHVFDDQPGGKRRFCINATVLEFVPRKNIAAN